MSTRKFFGVVAFYLLFFSINLFSQIIVEGVVTDVGSDPIQNALVAIIDQADSNRAFNSYTDEQGRYVIQIFETGVDDIFSQNPKTFILLQNYPNPFNPATVITYELSQPTAIRIEIHNVLGQKTKTLFNGFQTNQINRLIWDATDDYGNGVPAGVYFYSLKAEGIRITRKMLLIDGQRGYSNVVMSNPLWPDGSNQRVLNKAMSNQYVLRVSGDNIETYEQRDLLITSSMILNITAIRIVTDIDGNVYWTVKIGDQWWMAENLKVTHYCNGDAISHVTNNSEWDGLSTGTGAYCAYDNDESYVTNYGRLYNWYAVNDSRNIAPEGWHVPSNGEWRTLEDYLGGLSVAGGKLKETGTAHWDSPNTGATNESGFSALPGGFRLNDGYFASMGNSVYFWSSSEGDSYGAWGRTLNYDSSGVYSYLSVDKHYGFSVRCVRD